ncbi:hypothetical protein D3C78_1758010 [compost metagenome]
MADFQSIDIQRFAQPFDLRLGHFHLGATELGEVFRRDDPGQQAEDHQHHEQFEQGKTALATRTKLQLHDDLP